MFFSRSDMAMRVLGILLLALLLAEESTAGEISKEEFLKRRDHLALEIDSSSVAALHAAAIKQRSSDVNYRYRQESNLLYLTGLNEPNIALVLFGRPLELEGKAVRRIFLASEEIRNAHREEFSDCLLLDITRLHEMLEAALSGASTLYLSAPGLSFVNDWLNDRPIFLEREAARDLQRRFPKLKVKSVSPLVARLRERKSAAEIGLIRKAIEATGEGLRLAMQHCSPGAFEYELQAAVEYGMMREGAEYVGFPSIIGSGPNSLILHYDLNRRQMKEGEVVVMDVGAEMEGYSADVTRTIPVDGTYSPAQRKVYGAVLQAQRAVIRAIRPGLPFAEMDRIARAELGKEGFGKYLSHGVSHQLGLDTHDAGSLDTLRLGMVVTVEPGAYIPARDTTLSEEFRGWGVRIEDDVLVSDTGAVVLSGSIPKTIPEIEKIMKKY
jgi:Xaa-Pro aminopeptidase